MTTHTNKRIARITVEHWETGEIEVGVYTGDPGYVEKLPVCLRFPDEEPCLTSDAARSLAHALIVSADRADKAAVQSGGTTCA